MQLPRGVSVKRLLGAPQSTRAPPAAPGDPFLFACGRLCYGHPRTWLLELSVEGPEALVDGCGVVLRRPGMPDAPAPAPLASPASPPLDLFRLACLRVADTLALVRR